MQRRVSFYANGQTDPITRILKYIKSVFGGWPLETLRILKYIKSAFDTLFF